MLIVASKTEIHAFRNLASYSYPSFSSSTPGSLREPLLTLIGFLRSMELKLASNKNMLEMIPLGQKLGQGPYSFDSVL